MSSSPIKRSKDGGPPTKKEEILQLKTIWFSDVDPSLSVGADNGWYKHELVAVKKFKAQGIRLRAWSFTGGGFRCQVSVFRNDGGFSVQCSGVREKTKY